MEFKFNVNEVFGEPIVEIGSNLVPPGFTGDRRALWNTVGKVMEVVNALGEASAAAQGLTKPITTADRLRNSEHKIYLLIDQSANGGQGAVTGMLKTGQKGLYVFDREGQHHQVSPPCVLDFYVHESRQRTGLGRQLFEHMLQKEEIQPVKMAIDRPSEKFLGFLNKHYHLNQPIKQMNNYVVFDGFFEGDGTNSCADNNNSGTPRKPRSLSGANGLQTITSYGRYSAPRPACSMGQIIHNQSSTVQKPQEAQGAQIASQTKSKASSTYSSDGNKQGGILEHVEEVVKASPKLERPRSLSIQIGEDDQIDEILALPVHQPKIQKDEVEAVKEKIEKVVVSSRNSVIEEPAERKTPSHLTDQGFLDLKFYHNKLW